MSATTTKNLLLFVDGCFLKEERYKVGFILLILFH